jgi:plasmid stabilization system protein ParE
MLKWSRSAKDAYLSYLTHLNEVAPASAVRFQAELEWATAHLQKRPMIARKARWNGLREWSLLRWKN